MPTFTNREEYEKWKTQQVVSTAEKLSQKNSSTNPVTDMSEAVHVDSIQHPRLTLRQDQRVSIVLSLGLLIVGLVVGYFVGREHVKYELRSVFKQATKEFQRGFEAALAKQTPETKEKSQTTSSETPTAQLPNEPSKEPRKEPFRVELKSKGFREANYSAGLGGDAIVFTVAFTNLMGRDIRAFDGSLIFTDLLNNKILGANLSINDPVSHGDTLDWSGQIDFNQFIDRHRSLRSEEFANLKIVFEPRKILFSDGSMSEYK